MEEKKFRYADVEEQTKRANTFLTLGFVVFYVFVLGIVGIACMRGVRTVGYTSMIATIIVIASAIVIILNKRNATDPKTRYVALAGLMFVTFLMTYAFDNYYVKFMAVIPFVGCILFLTKNLQQFPALQWEH